jgi:inorganic pyrophosphatase
MSEEFRNVVSVPESDLVFDVTIEIPRGTKNKFEMDHETGRLVLDRPLFTSTQYPYDYGFVEKTLGEDGDPLDAMVILTEPTFPGCMIRCRALAMFQMQDEMGGDDKVLCVPVSDTRRNYLDDIDDIAEYMLLEIEHFFTVYKDLEPGKSVEGAKWVGRKEAEAEIRASWKRAEGTDYALPSMGKGSLGDPAVTAPPTAPKSKKNWQHPSR